MSQLTDGRQAEILPSTRFWRGVLLGYPLVLVLPGVAAVLGDDVSWAWPATVVALVYALIGMLGDRHVRTMALRWRAVWSLIGLGVAATIAAALAVAGIYVFVVVSCWGVEQCFS